MKRDDSVYLRHILDAIAQISGYLEGHDEASFRQTRLVQDGVIRQLEIIGEAVKQLSPTIRSKNAKIPWVEMPGCVTN